MKRGAKKSLIRLGKVLAIIGVLLVVSTIGNWVISLRQYPDLVDKYQSCVYLGTECMNTYREGNGNKTVVIIPDFEVLVPFVDYRPLIDELSLDYDVLLVEPYGKGLSDITSEERTLNKIVNELHRVISLSGVSDQYILMTSGYGSLYALEYLTMFGDEVEMYVAIDPVAPTQVNHFKYDSQNFGDTLVQKLGLARLAMHILPDLIVPSKYLNNYSSIQKKTMYSIASMKYANKNILEEGKQMNKAMKELQSKSIPTSIPTLYFIPQSTIDKYDWWLPEQEAMVANVKNSKIRISRSYQYMHRSNYHEVGVYLENFINELEQGESQE